MTQTVQTPALTASQSSWRSSQAHDRDGWLALMADDVVIEDPIGKSVTNPDGDGVTYRVNDAGLITNMRGYWNLDVMKFGKEESAES
jgi:steroid delta-isomerase